VLAPGDEVQITVYWKIGRTGGGCYCDWPDMHASIDAADRVFIADIDLHMVKILDTAGNMIARFGRWGNAGHPCRKRLPSLFKAGCRCIILSLVNVSRFNRGGVVHAFR
jgi:hypothetical protein